MRPWRHTAASVVAVSAVLLGGPAEVTAASPTPTAFAARQCLRAAAALAADTYRQQRRRILGEYRESTRSAHHALRLALLHARTPAERDQAWQEYTERTAPLRAVAHARLTEARAEFRATVERAREQFGVEDAPVTHSTVRWRRTEGPTDTDSISGA